MRDLPNAPQGPLSLGDGGRILTDNAGGAQFGEASHTLLWMLAGPQGPRQVTHLASVVGGAAASAVDPVAPILATGEANGVIRLWTVSPSGQPSPLATLSGTTAPPVTLAFSPDGHTLASADSDGNIHLWDISNAQAPITMGNFAMPPGGSNLISVSQPALPLPGQPLQMQARTRSASLRRSRPGPDRECGPHRHRELGHQRRRSDRPGMRRQR